MGSCALLAAKKTAVQSKKTKNPEYNMVADNMVAIWWPQQWLHTIDRVCTKTHKFCQANYLRMWVVGPDRPGL